MNSRTSILDSATRLFARQGFSAVSLREIAEQVGISKPSLLYHFASKEALRASVLDNLFNHWATTLPRLLRAVTSGEGQFEALMRELHSFFAEDADRARLVIRELLDRPEEIRSRVAESLRPLTQLIADYMRRGQTSGMLQEDVDPESYIIHMISMTLSASVAAAAIAPIFANGVDAGDERHHHELMRIARSSLFAPAGASAASPTITGKGM